MTPTACQLFAGVPNEGPERCFYCGGRCCREHAAAKRVKPTFTGLGEALRTEWVCTGCIAAMCEDATITLACGEIRHGQKTRGYSWVVDANGRIAATKSHRQWLLETCCNPPSAPFVICISDSGQRHLLYQSKVNTSRDVVVVSLEGELILYEPAALSDRLMLCKKVCAATGKPAMKDQMDPQTMMRIVDHFESEDVLAAWQDCFFEPLTRLAVWLCPPKDECLNEYPAANAPRPVADGKSRRVPKKTSRSGRSVGKARPELS